MPEYWIFKDWNQDSKRAHFGEEFMGRSLGLRERMVCGLMTKVFQTKSRRGKMTGQTGQCRLDEDVEMIKEMEVVVVFVVVVVIVVIVVMSRDRFLL